MVGTILDFGRAIVQMAATGFKWLFTGGRWKLALIAMTAILAAYLTYQVRKTRTENTRLSEQVAAREGEIELLTTAREADNQAVGNNAAAKREIIQREQRSSARTEAALAANPDWADQPIPADVLDSLRE